MTVENKTGISFFKLISKSATIKRGEAVALNQCIKKVLKKIILTVTSFG
jgi:hypothetical protein